MKAAAGLIGPGGGAGGRGGGGLGLGGLVTAVCLVVVCSDRPQTMPQMSLATY